MAQGILGGIALGAVFSVGVAGVVSVLVPMEPQQAPQVGSTAPAATSQTSTPQATAVVTGEGSSLLAQPQVSLRAPSGEELPKEPSATALAPQTTTQIVATVLEGAVAADPATAPQSEVVASLATPSTLSPVGGAASDSTPVVPTALPQPQTGQAADLTQPRPLPQSIIARAGEDEPVLPNPQALAPMIRDDSQDADVTALSQPAQAAEPVQSEEAQTAEPQTTELQPEDLQTEQVTSEQHGEETFIVVEPAPVPAAEWEDHATKTAQAAKPRVLTVPGTQVGTLGSVRPRVGTPATTLINRSGEKEAIAVESITPAPENTEADTRPIRIYAQPFENPEGKPLMGIVLMDTGADLDAAEIGLPALSSFPYPVSFAVDASLIDAAQRVERYRAEGFDVLAMVDLPQGGRPTDAEVSISVALNGMPEIVGVLEGTGVGLQGSREVADQVTRILQASGHGLVAQSKGLNSMLKLALKEGVPAAPVFRDFDSQNQQPRVIRRFLDQAAFKAGQEGGVIMLGRLRPETIEALLVWGLADRAGSVALAPVSAVLLGLR
jgi:polysaccharide deacetylase 2 family uncharacterized protein YibQ